MREMFHRDLVLYGGEIPEPSSYRNCPPPSLDDMPEFKAFKVQGHTYIGGGARCRTQCVLHLTQEIKEQRHSIGTEKTSRREA